MGQNLNKGFYFVVVLLFLISCTNEFPTREQVVIQEMLPTFFCKKDSSTWVAKEEIKNKVLVLNSEKEVSENIQTSFLENYPSYLNVDFDNYTLLVITDMIGYEIVDRDICITKDLLQHSYHFQIDYIAGNPFEGNDYYIERIAVVVDKIEDNAKITYGTSVRQK